MDSFFIFLLVLVAATIVTLFFAVNTVPQGYQWTVERFGRYRTTLMPGLNLIFPFIDMIGRRINVQESVLEIPSQPVITKDNASVIVDGVCFSRFWIRPRPPMKCRTCRRRSSISR